MNNFIKAVSKSHSKTDNNGNKITVGKKDNAALIELLQATRLITELMQIERDNLNKVKILKPNGYFFTYQVLISDDSKYSKSTLSVFPVGTKACIYITETTGSFTSSYWLTPSKCEYFFEVLKIKD